MQAGNQADKDSDRVDTEEEKRNAEAEGFLIELNLSSCYDFVEQCCVCISNHLSVMNKQRECPEECGEAAASLMFAAARFADLPELRDLRSIFTERYRNSLDFYVNKEFVEKLKSLPPTKDKKLQLLQDIALESGVELDLKALEQKLYNPPASVEDWPTNNNDKYKLHNSRDETVWKMDELSTGYEHGNVKEHIAPKRNEEDLPFNGREKVINDEYKLDSRTENGVPERNSRGHLSHEKLEDTPIKDIQVATIHKRGQENDSNVAKSVSKEYLEEKKPFSYRSIPPPYTKPNVSKKEASLEVRSAGEGLRSTKLSVDVDGDDNLKDDSVGEAKPKSVRRRHLKLPPGHDSGGSSEGDNRKMNQHGMRKEDANKGHKTLEKDGHDQRDEEETMMDRLLIKYSTKRSPHQPSQAESTLKPPPASQQAAIDTAKTSRRKSIDGPPARATSLPIEPTSSTDATKGHARASSFQPEMLNPKGHVHPKLPEYDDFIARLAALKSGN
ncbi:unnamed protein product [Ilex paraguariensis]|uniref:Regulator of Vps4 activity in the MVB pathway protein n=1 Tax=Ilex paraguariensis TaxID=185542 RepID=A0ABC8UX61_9AQUA